MKVLFLALTDPQTDQLIQMLHDVLMMLKEAVLAVWTALAPFLMGYLVYRQAQNRKALDENTKVSIEAFEVANGHNEKIATLTKQITENPQKVEVINDTSHPIPTEKTHRK